MVEGGPPHGHQARCIGRDTPTDDDRDILAGISVMVLAIANRQNLADQPHMQGQLEEAEEPLPCGSVTTDASGSCVREVGHSGRHKYRPLGFEELVN